MHTAHFMDGFPGDDEGRIALLATQLAVADMHRNPDKSFNAVTSDSRSMKTYTQAAASIVQEAKAQAERIDRLS